MMIGSSRPPLLGRIERSNKWRAGMVKYLLTRSARQTSASREPRDGRRRPSKYLLLLATIVNDDANSALIYWPHLHMAN
jgi:hypothetical protein